MQRFVFNYLFCPIFALLLCKSFRNQRHNLLKSFVCVITEYIQSISLKLCVWYVFISQGSFSQFYVDKLYALLGKNSFSPEIMAVYICDLQKVCLCSMHTHSPVPALQVGKKKYQKTQTSLFLQYP